MNQRILSLLLAGTLSLTLLAGCAPKGSESSKPPRPPRWSRPPSRRKPTETPVLPSETPETEPTETPGACPRKHPRGRQALPEPQAFGEAQCRPLSKAPGQP